MAVKTVKLLTNAADIPLLYTQTPRQAVDNTDASPRMPNAFYGDLINADFGYPQLVFAENIMPYAKGIFSVSYVSQASPVSPAVANCDQCISLRDVSENIFAFIPARGSNYVYNPVTAVWNSVNPFVWSTGTLVTRAYVNGRTFVCYEKNRIIELVGGVFVTISLTYPSGYTIASIRGIGSAGNYLLLFTELEVLWCSPLNILDFSNLDAGAGQQIPIDLKGQITALLTVSGGFICYTARNAVGATFTNNGNAPFAFKEIANAGGVATWERVSDSSDAKGHYVWGTNGLQHITLAQADTLHPEVTDFLVGNLVEMWNSTTKQVELATSPSAFAVKVAFLAGRYLVLSYGSGTTDYQFALVHDTSLKRWGKLKIDHADAFMYPYVSGTGAYTYDTLPGYYADLGDTDYAGLGILYLAVTPAKRGIAFLKPTGEIFILSLDFNQLNAPGVAVFGHIQQRHDRKVTIQELVLDGAKNMPAAPTVTLLGAVNGYDRDTVTPVTLSDSSAKYHKYNSRVTSENFDIAVEGNIVLSTALAKIMLHGSR